MFCGEANGPLSPLALPLPKYHGSLLLLFHHLSYIINALSFSLYQTKYTFSDFLSHLQLEPSLCLGCMCIRGQVPSPSLSWDPESSVTIQNGKKCTCVISKFIEIILVNCNVNHMFMLIFFCLLKSDQNPAPLPYILCFI